jgi:hypothetical protein
MMTEWQVEHPGVALHLAAINLTGLESYADDMGAQGVLPILQDTATDDVWGAWGAVWRDVVILDGDNARRSVYNLTSHDLADPVHRDELEQLLLDAALP